jgi:hypothetical protein
VEQHRHTLRPVAANPSVFYDVGLRWGTLVGVQNGLLDVFAPRYEARDILFGEEAHSLKI